MAICRWYGNPHLFITFTANPRLPEIVKMLEQMEGQRAEDRPNVVARVFRLKLKQLIRCLKEKRYFGTVVEGIVTNFFN